MFKMSRQVGVGVLAAVLTLGAGYVVVISPQSADTSEVRQQVADVREQNDKTAARLPTLKGQLTSISSDVSALRDMSKQVPRDMDLPALHRQINQAARSVGVQVTNISVSTPQVVQTESTSVEEEAESESSAEQQASTPVLASYTVNLTVDSSAGKAHKFLTALSKIERLNVVSSTSLSGTSSDTGVGSMAITATFFLQQVDVDALAEQIEALANNSGEPVADEDAVPADAQDADEAPDKNDETKPTE